MEQTSVLTPAVFFPEFRILSERFGQTKNAEIMGRYLDYLIDAGMTAQDFKTASLRIFNTETFFPSPARFLEILHGEAESQALEYWGRIVERLAAGESPLTPANSLERKFLNICCNGNASALGQMEYRQIDAVKRDFIKMMSSEISKKPLAAPQAPALELPKGNTAVMGVLSEAVGKWTR